LASELCQTIGDELFFTWYIFLKVGKTQDLPSKFWQTLGDALSFTKAQRTFMVHIHHQTDIQRHWTNLIHPATKEKACGEGGPL
jgi:hypothetical protein